MKIKKYNDVLLAILIFAIAAFLSVAFTGCEYTQTSNQASTNKTVYKCDMFGSINGTDFKGVAVLPYSTQYEFKIESKEDIDLLTISTCHRDISIESAIQQGWFKKKRGYTYTISTSKGLEDKYCPFTFGSYNKENSDLTGWAFVDFETPEATLGATNYCNGITTQTRGVSICQTRDGLIQGLKFNSRVRVSSKLKKECDTLKTLDFGYTWEYTMPLGKCVYAFIEESGTKIHRHTTLGYNKIKIRGE